MERVRLHDGSEVFIRPLRRDDGPRLQAAYDRLSEATKYRRFLAPKPHLRASEVSYLVDVDGHDHVALAALPVDDPERIIAVARFVRLPEDPAAAELALVVGDRFQGQGLGTALLARLIAVAGTAGIERIRASMLADNLAAHRLVGSFSAGAPRRVRSAAVEQVDIPLAA